MVFTTLTFPVFLVVVFAAYWTLRDRRAQNVLLVAANYVFYGWWDWRFCALMAFSTLVDFLLANRIDATNSPARRRLLLSASLVFNLGLLAFFKYFNFFADSFAQAAQAIGWTVHPVLLHVVLPVGISFYTFQTLSYTLDVYSGRMRSSRSLLDYLAFVSFFPQLVAGPIERAINLLPQFQRERRFDATLAADGCRQILWGFFKKLAIAERLAVSVDSAYAHPDAVTGGGLVLATIFFAFQIYCDFSAYSDIAIGTARLFGFSIMRNFAYPYFSQDVAEFWRRWHISLSTWFRDYLFIPLGGSRGTPRRTALNTMLTFTVSGAWHGAAWQYLAWGSLNGAAVVPHTLGLVRGSGLKSADTPGGENLLPSPTVLAKMAATFGFVCVAWVFFRAGTFGSACHILGRIIRDPLHAHVMAPANLQNLGLIAVLVGCEWTQRRHPHPLHLERMSRPVRWAIYTALIWLTFGLMPTSPSPFIYFQF